MLFYIDPGTGSMLFTILIGVIGAGIYLLRNVFIKMKFMFSSGGKAKEEGSSSIAIFTDSKRYYSMFKPLCDELEARGEKVTYLTAEEDDPLLNEKYENVSAEFIGTGNKAFARMNLLKSDIVLSSTPGLGVYQWKRSRDVKWYIHIPHMANDITTYKMFALDYFDAVLVSGDYQEEQIRSLEALRGLKAKEVRLVGLPQFDALKQRLENEGKIKSDVTTVMIAPSWGSSSIFNRYGGKIIDALLKTDYRIIIRPHPQSYTSEKELIDSLMSQYPQNDRLEWDRSTDNFMSLNKADILISDFSGVIFEFALVFGKPVIYADVSFDKAPYDAWWLDEELWTFKILPKLGMQLTSENLDEIETVISKCLSSKEFAEGRIQAIRETWGNTGHSISAIADYLIEVKNRIEKGNDGNNAGESA